MDILVIGQENSNLKNLISLLREAGYDVLTVGSSREAMRLPEIEPLRLVLLDIAASRREGYQFDRRLRRKFDAEIIDLGAAQPSQEIKWMELLAQVQTLLQRPPQVEVSPFDKAFSALETGQSNILFKDPKEQMRIGLTSNRSHSAQSGWGLQLSQALAHLHPLTTAWGYLVLLALAEIVTVAGSPQLGLALYGLWLMVLLLHSALTWERPSHRLLLSLTLIPLLRIISLSLPLANLPLLVWFLLITFPLLIAVVLIVRIFQISWSELGLTLRQLPLQIAIGSTGLVLGYLGYHLLQPAPLLTPSTWLHYGLAAIVLFLCTGLTEEVIFRGIIQRAAIESLGSFALIFTAALYTVLQVGHRSPLLIPFVFGVSLCLGWSAAKTRSLVGVILCHGLINLIIFLGLPG